jgi:transcriptional regulator with XRE-family HTH domain
MADKGWDLGGYLREQREHARLSVRQLANLAGVSNPYLSQVERGLRKPSAEVLQQIARGLRISAEALYVRAGILDSEGRPDVEAAVNSDPDLNDRQRRVLLDIYASFRAENKRAAAPEGPEPAPVPKRRPAARVRSAAKKSAKTATRTAGRAARAAAASEPSPSVPPTEPSVAEVPAVADVAVVEAAALETAAAETAAAETDSAQTDSAGTTPDRSVAASTTATAGGRASGRVARKRATARTAKRTTARSTKAAPRATAAGNDPTPPEPGGAPDAHL